MNDYIKVDHISTDRLIQELERREREEPGAWTGQQQRRIWQLASKLNPLSLDASPELVAAWRIVERSK